MSTITITGNLAADPEVVRIPSGREVTRMRVIENRRRLNADTGEWEDAEPNAFNVQAWDSLGANAAASLTKGATVDIVGHIVTDRWTDKDTGESRTGHQGAQAGRELIPTVWAKELPSPTHGPQ